MRVTTHSTHIPLIGVHVIPVEAPSSELIRALVELFPNPRVRDSSGVHGSVGTRGIDRRYVGTKINEEVEGIHVLSNGKPLQLRLENDHEVHYSKTASLAQPAAIMMQVLVMTYEEEDEEDEEDTAPTW